MSNTYGLRPLAPGASRVLYSLDQDSYFGNEVEEVVENATPSFRTIEDLASIVHMPVEIADEPTGWIPEVLDQIRTQRVSLPTATLIHANSSPEGLGSRRAYENLDTLREYQAGYPDFPLSFFVSHYRPGTSISSIRHNLQSVGQSWYGQQARKQRFRPNDIMMASWSIDTRHVPENYLEGLHYARYTNDADFLLTCPDVRHDRLDERFPRINKLLEWYDAAPALSPDHLAVNLEAVLKTGGYPYDVALNEERSLRMRLAHMARDEGKTYDEVILQATATMSSRKFIAQIMTDQVMDYVEVKTHLPETQSYRQPAIPRADISRLNYLRRVKKPIYTAVRSSLVDAFYESLEDREPNEALTHALDIAQSEMRKVLNVTGERRNLAVQYMILSSLIKAGRTSPISTQLKRAR